MIMPQRVFQETWHIQGTLGANFTLSYTAPFAVQLIHVSLNNTAATGGTLKIGTAADDDGYLLAETFGVSGTPVEVKTPAGFDGVLAGGAFPHIAAGTVVLLTVTDNSMAGATVVLTLTEG
jgi:hypothetical protein